MKQTKTVSRAAVDEEFKQAMAAALESTKAQLLMENARLKSENAELTRKATAVGRDILQERAKLIVGKTWEDHDREVKCPLPVALWMCAQGLMGDTPARHAAHEIDNAKRRRIGLAEKPLDDFWIRHGG